MEEKRAYGIFADLLLEEKVYMDRRITFARSEPERSGRACPEGTWYVRERGLQEPS